MNIQQIDTEDKQAVDAFIRFPFDLYRKNRYWVPPFPGEMKLVMDKTRHPFYKHSRADFFVALDDDRVVGRIAVLKNRNYCDFHKINTAFAYYLEMQEDQEIAEALFSSAEEWARKNGAESLLVGKGFLRSNGQGIHVKGFDLSPAMGIAYQFPYYDILIKACGYAKETDFFSGKLEHHLDPKIHEVADKVRARGEFWIKSFTNLKEMETWIPRVDEIHHEAFAANPGFYPSTPEEFALICRNIIAIADPAFIKLIMHEDEIAGFIISYPNINHALRATDGRGTLRAMIRLLCAKQFTRWIDVNGVGLLPKFQGLGGNALLYSEIENVLTAAGMRHAEIIQVDERNFRSRSEMDALGVEWNKIHRTYQKKLD